MAGPWEKFAAQEPEGPWKSFQQAEPSPEPSAKPAARQEPKIAPSAFKGGTLAGIWSGIRDPIDAGAQMLVRGAAALGLAPESEVARVDEIARTANLEREASRRMAQGGNLTGLVTGEAPELGADWARMGGNVLTALIPGSQVPRAATLGGRVGLGAATGAGMGVLQPVTQGDFAEEKAKQAALGAAFGGALPAVAGGVARVIRPNTTPQAQALLAEGITPTPGQILGGGFKTAEEKLASVPILGSAIRAGQQRAGEQFSTAAINRALAPIGQRLPQGATGREAIQHAEDALSSRYTDVLNRIGAVRTDARLGADLQNLNRLLINQPKEIAEQFERIIQNEVSGRVNPQGFMTSEAMKAAESNLGNVARGYRRSQDYDQRVLGEALDEAQNALRQWVQRTAPPGLSRELADVNRGWANFKRVQRAAGSVGADEGAFTPAQLQSAVKALDRSKDKAAFSRGNALMQDLSEAGKTTLASRVPNSGTADRLLAAGMVGAPLAGAAINPAVALAALPSLLYTPMGQRLAAAALTARPQGAQALSNLVRQTGRTPVAPVFYLGPQSGEQ